MGDMSERNGGRETKEENRLYKNGSNRFDSHVIRR